MRKYFFRKTWKYFFKEMRTYFFKEIWKYFLKNIYGYKILIEYFPPSLPLLKVAQGKLDHNWPWPRSCPRPCLDTFIFSRPSDFLWANIENVFLTNIENQFPSSSLSGFSFHQLPFIFLTKSSFFYELITPLN